MSPATAPTAPAAVRAGAGTVAVVAVAQLVVALDATVLTVALPSIQRDLGFGDAARASVIVAYTAALAGGLLLGGRVVDAAGRRRTLLGGLAAFAAASVVAALAPSLPLLLAGRIGQGLAAALMIPGALSVLGTFRDPAARARAFGVYGAVAASGGVLGLVVGGLLTSHAGWRACLLAVGAVAAAAGVATLRVLPPDGAGTRRRLDAAGALTGGGALVALVLAAGSGAPPTSPRTWVPAAAGVALVAAFVLRRRRATDPLVPAGLVDRPRTGWLVAVAVAVVGVFGLFLVLTYHLQVVLGLDPQTAGLAFLPLSAASVLGGAVLAARLTPRLGARRLVLGGLVLIAAGLTGLVGLGAAPDLAVVVGVEVVVGLGAGAVFSPAISSATAGVVGPHAGVAAALAATAQQVGASLGTTVLNRVAVAVTTATPAGSGALDARTTGHVVAAVTAAAVVLAGAAAVAALTSSGGSR